MKTLTVTFEITVPDEVDDLDIQEMIEFDIGSTGGLKIETMKRLEAHDIHDVTCMQPDYVIID